MQENFSLITKLEFGCRWMNVNRSRCSRHHHISIYNNECKLKMLQYFGKSESDIFEMVFCFLHQRKWNGERFCTQMIEFAVQLIDTFHGLMQRFAFTQLAAEQKN